MKLRHLRLASSLQFPEERVTRAHQLNPSWINVDYPGRVSAAADAEGLTPRIVCHRSAIVFHTVADSDPIDGDHIALVLDRPRPREDVPVRAPPLGPIRDQQCGIDLRRNG